jgi:hypothetical protein
VKTEKKEDGTRAGTDFDFSPAAVTGLIGGIYGRRLVRSEAPVCLGPKSGGAPYCQPQANWTPVSALVGLSRIWSDSNHPLLDYQRQQLTDLQGG